MFFGDRFKNTVSTTQVNRFLDGRDAFHLFLLESMREDKPYDQMAREILTSGGNASGRGFPEFSNLEDAEAALRDYETYPVTGTPAGYIVGALTTGGPIHDTWDAMAVNTATDFLGIAHMDCLLCHDGAGHLDSLSLWGEQAKRNEAWGLAAFFSRTAFTRPRIRTNDGSRPYPLRYWEVFDLPRTAYILDTTTGNRPERQPAANGGLPFVPPSYPFTAPTGSEPTGDESFRQALGRVATADPQFARTIVNALWKEFFSRGLVEPADRFDPARLDGDNPPPAPWEVQPSHPKLLEFLTQGFIDNGFGLKWLMKEITSSATYQLSSRYEGTWNPAYEPYFARFQVRRLRAEEIHDALLTSSGVPVPYIVSHTFGVKFFRHGVPRCPRCSPAAAARGSAHRVCCDCDEIPRRLLAREPRRHPAQRRGRHHASLAVDEQRARSGEGRRRRKHLVDTAGRPARRYALVYLLYVLGAEPAALRAGIGPGRFADRRRGPAGKRGRLAVEPL